MGPPQTPKLTQRELDEKIRSVHTELVREQAIAMRKLIDKTKAMLTPNVLAKVRGCAMRMSMLPQAVCLPLMLSMSCFRGQDLPSADLLWRRRPKALEMKAPVVDLVEIQLMSLLNSDHKVRGAGGTWMHLRCSRAVKREVGVCRNF